MTVTELKEKLEQLEELGYGQVTIGLPVDKYSEWITGIDKIQYRPHIHAVVLCDAGVEAGGIDIC